MMLDSDAKDGLEPDESQPGDGADDVLAHNQRLLDEFLAQGDAEAPSIEDDLPPEHRSGVVAVVGKPNVGKSTLMNAYLGEKVAIVTPKPQTTRERQLGILTRPDAQIVFVDTPGIHLARTRLGEYMVAEATGTIPDADVVLFIVDVSEMPTRADEIIAGLIARQAQGKAILALNKCDLAGEEEINAHSAAYSALLPQAEPVLLSATEGTNRDQLLERLVKELPNGPRFYPADQLTETQLRESAAELIREQVLLMYEQEIPHSVAVTVNEFKERDEDMTYIAATIFVERESQKRIVIGSGGQALKELGQRARSELETMLGSRVYLDLWVKVMKNWRKDEHALRRLGYTTKR